METNQYQLKTNKTLYLKGLKIFYRYNPALSALISHIIVRDLLQDTEQYVSSVTWVIDMNGKNTLKTYFL